METNTFNQISKEILTILVNNNCTVHDAENILRDLMTAIRATSTVQFNENVINYYK